MLPRSEASDKILQRYPRHELLLAELPWRVLGDEVDRHLLDPVNVMHPGHHRSIARAPHAVAVASSSVSRPCSRDASLPNDAHRVKLDQGARYLSTMRLERWATLIAIGITVLILATVVVVVALLPSPAGMD